MLKSILASTAALGLAITPVAAQAGTRSADAVVSLDRAGAGIDQPASNFDGEDLRGLWWLFGGAILAGIILVIAGDSDEDNASPGAN